MTTQNSPHHLALIRSRHADNGIPVPLPAGRVVHRRTPRQCPRCGRLRNTRDLEGGVFYLCRTPGCFGRLERVRE